LRRCTTGHQRDAPVCYHSIIDALAHILINAAAPQAVNVTLQYSLTDYSGGTCLVVAGHALSKGVIIVIVVIAVLALIVLAVLIKCCCFCL